MCGIISLYLLNKQKFFQIILDSLKQLQNRGYDSAGISFFQDKNIITTKYASDDISAIQKLQDNFDSNHTTNIAIAHTRWATHGPKTTINSHPHHSFDEQLFLVHNGIIENYYELKQFLIKQKITFYSQTDTEVIANLIQYHYIIHKDLPKAINIASSQMTGTWGLSIIHKDFPNQLFIIRHGSPILIGYEDNMVMIASETSGFANKVKNYYVLDNQDLAIISTIDNKININTKKTYITKELDTTSFQLTPEPYPHWTIKEIMEQPEAIMRAISFGGRLYDNNVRLGGLESNKSTLCSINNIIILGCGTSLHAGLIGAEYFKDLCNFFSVQVFDGAEFNISDIPKVGTTALIYLSQSGETKDLHRCIQIGKDNDLFQIGVINVVDSLIAREVDCGCYINAGREVGVASTKSFTNQVVLLSMIAIWFSQLHNTNKNKRKKYMNDLRNLSKHYREALEISNEDKNKDLLCKIINHDSLFILGKNKSRFIAREAALKIKEICYLHAEGYSGSALKHGPFALLDEKHPVILLAPNNLYYNKIMNAKEEILSRNSPVLIISNKKSDYDKEIILPTNDTYQDLLNIIPLQIGSYFTSIKNNINCDQPKNLAKCVNVE